MKAIVFYTWQSDTRAAANRTLIEDALCAAAKQIRDDDTISVVPVVDRDTLDTPGAPDIGATIFEKIDASELIVADITIVNSGSQDRPTPNPNVLIELGYALKSLGERRIILVQNTAFGGPELLPFDLRQKRVLTYESLPEARSRIEARQQLQARLRHALTLILQEQGQITAHEWPVELTISYSYDNQSISQERHDYQLQVKFKNIGTQSITQWHVDLEIPTRLLEPNVAQVLRVPGRNDQEQTLLRATQDTHPGVVYPGDTKLAMIIDYRVDGDIYENQRGLFEQRVSAVAYVNEEIGAVAERAVSDLNIF